MPVENFEVFSYEFELAKGFRSASGTLHKKETFYFCRKDQQNKLIELPLSPSMGFKTDEFKHLIQADPEKLRSHKLVQNILTWFDADLSELPSPEGSHFYDFRTLGIGDPIPDSFPGILKLKADLETFSEIASLSHRLTEKNQLWSVDFNRSLTPEALSEFFRLANLRLCFCIEQPLSLGQINRASTEKMAIFLDEEMEIMSPERWLQINPRGFVLKYFRHSWQEYKKWHKFALANQVPYFVGSMIQSEIADSLCCQLNERAPVRYSCNLQPPPLSNYLLKSRLLGVI